MYYCRICSAEYAKKKNPTLPVPIEILQASLYCLGTVFFFFIPLEGMKQMLMKERGWKRSCFLKPLYIVSESFGEHQVHVASMFQPYRFPALSASFWFQLCYILLMYIHMTCIFNCTVSSNKQNKQNRQTRQRNKRTNEQTNNQTTNQTNKQRDKQTTNQTKRTNTFTICIKLAQK